MITLPLLAFWVGVARPSLADAPALAQYGTVQMPPRSQSSDIAVMSVASAARAWARPAERFVLPPRCEVRLALLDQSSVKNRLLTAMKPGDFAALSPHLLLVELPRSQNLVFPERRIEHCWFIDEGIASLVATSSDGHETEAGIVGWEGMVDLAIILGADRSPLRCFMQVGGRGYRVPVALLRGRMDASSELRSLLNQYAYGCFVDVAETALANASFTVEERLARWLLMCADRLGRNHVPLTHEILAVMLNVRRAGVTLALHSLETAGLLEARRGIITIVDRLALERLAHDVYRPIARS